MIEEIKVVNKRTEKSITMGTDSRYDYIVPQGGFDFGEVEADHTTFTYPGQVGSFISNTKLGNRSFSMFGYVVGTESDIKRKKRLLSDFMNPFDEIEIQAEGYSLYGKPESNVHFGKEYADNNSVLCKFLIDILCNKPLFEESKSNEVALAILTAAFHFPLTIVPSVKNGGVIFGKRRKELFSEVVNDGAVEVGIEVYLHATGIVNNPQITFVEQNTFFRINKVMQEGEEIKLSTIDGERFIRGRLSEADPYESYLDYWDENSTWLKFPIGKTTVGFKTKLNGVEDDTYKNLEVLITYKKKKYNLDGE